MSFKKVIQDSPLLKNVFSTCILAASVAGCLHDADEENKVVIKNTMAVVTTIQPDWSGGAHSVIAVDADRIATNNLLPTNSSDLVVVSDGVNFYRIDRTHGGVLKISSENPDEPVFERSVNGDDPLSNPQGIAFVDSTKAYVFRYHSNKVWEINPSATLEADFKVDEIDFSHHADPDGKSEPVAGIVAGNRLFILLQNMEDRGDYNYVPATAYVAVIDIGTNQEIDTDATIDGVQPITLPVKNPGKMIFQESMDKIFVQASGDTYPENDYTGGIATIDINNYSVVTLIDDNATTYSISNMAIVSDSTGYYVGYKGYQDNYLFQFNPATGEVASNSIVAFDGKDLADIEVDKDGKLWVASYGESGIYVYDPVTNQIDGSLVSTGLNPSDITFVELPTVSETVSQP